MSSVTLPTSARKVSRPDPPPVLARWVARPADACPTGCAHLSRGRDAGLYLVTELTGHAVAGGRLFAVVKADGTAYHAMLANPQDRSCTCAGFCYHGHCKHLTGLELLLTEPAAAPEPVQETCPDCGGALEVYLDAEDGVESAYCADCWAFGASASASVAPPACDDCGHAMTARPDGRFTCPRCPSIAVA